MPIHDQSNINLLIGILENEFNRKSVVSGKFVDFFNKRLEIYHEKRFNYADLQQMNKCILSDCYQFINRENIEIEKNTMVLKPPPSNHGFQTTTDNIKSKNNSAFDDYKTQYDTMLNPAKPGEIDFSDTIEDEPILNIDTIVNQTLEERAKELQRISNTYSDKPPDWIKPLDAKEQQFENNHIKLIIEDEPITESSTNAPTNANTSNISNTRGSISQNKRVSFNFDDNSTTNSSLPNQDKTNVTQLLSKLKQKQTQPPKQEPLLNLTDINKLIFEMKSDFELQIQNLNKKYDTLQENYNNLQENYNNLQENYNNLQENYNNLQEQFDKNITTNDNDEEITKQ
jgi:hypothetical protein